MPHTVVEIAQLPKLIFSRLDVAPASSCNSKSFFSQSCTLGSMISEPGIETVHPDLMLPVVGQSGLHASNEDAEVQETPRAVLESEASGCLERTW